MATPLTAAAHKYFEVWNTRDCAAVGALFTESGSLRDWDLSVSGAVAVGEANGKIFAAVPAIAIEVLSLHESPSTRTVTAEIIVHLNDADKTTLKVADVITFDESLRIVSVRAYKG